MGTDRTDRKTDKTERNWVVVRIDGKVAAVSTDYRMLARISGHLASRDGGKTGQGALYSEITATTVSIDEVWKLRLEVGWDDLMLFGTDFQKKVWRKLWELTHAGEELSAQTGNSSAQTENSTEPTENITGQTGNITRQTEDSTRQGNAEPTEKKQATRLVSYSDFAELCQNRAGVRAVAHAIGLNPVSVIIPCHLVIPKEGIDKIREIHNRAQSTIFKGDDLCIGSILADTSIDFGEYALGKSMKRELIIREITEKSV